MSITSIIIFAEVVCFILIQKNIYIDAFATNPSHKEIIIRERLKQFKSKPKEPGANISSEQVNYSEAYKAPLLSIYYYKPNTDTKAILTAENKTLYDVTYGIDQYSRRKGIVHEKKDQYLLAFGGSFVFGEGVENNETLPSRITHYSKKFQAYNFGSQGAAVNNLIVNFKNKKNYRDGIKQKEGKILYFFYEYHLKRLFSQFNMYQKKVNKTFKGHMPEVSDPLTLNYNEKEELIYYGKYSELHPIRYRLKNFFSYSNILRFFKVGIPLRWSNEHFKYLQLVLNDLEKECKKHIGPTETYIILAHYFNPKFKNQFKRYFRDTSIKILDVSDLGFGDEHIQSVGRHNFYVPGDGHPNKSYHDLFGELLAEKLDSL